MNQSFGEVMTGYLDDVRNKKSPRSLTPKEPSLVQLIHAIQKQLTSGETLKIEKGSWGITPKGGV